MLAAGVELPSLRLQSPPVAVLRQRWVQEINTGHVMINFLGLLMIFNTFEQSTIYENFL